MKRKHIVYEGLGFPVVIRNCPIKKIRNAEAPDINMNDLMALVFDLLITKPERLSGSQIRFIRSYLELSQKDFARMLNQKGHSIVSTWESKKNNITGMDLNTEIILRQKMAMRSKNINADVLLEGIKYINAVEINPVEVELNAA